MRDSWTVLHDLTVLQRLPVRTRRMLCRPLHWQWNQEWKMACA
jgi:hypothetical protein